MRRSTGTLEPEAPEIEITRMRRRHVRGVMTIERQVYPRPWSQSLFLSEIRLGAARVYLVALAAGEVVGYGGMMWHGEECHITTLAVHPEWRRRRIGSRILHTLVWEARELGADSISLEVRTANWAAQRMYGRFGFRPIGVRKGYYQETGEDALIMWVDDIRTQAYTRQLARLSAGIPSTSEDTP